MMRARSHRYPGKNDDYMDTTYYDKYDNYLDIGYQRLKIINLKLYPELSNVKSLFIDHNCLTDLPDPIHVPNLTGLNCSHNKLEYIPFYPNLTLLIVCDNKIKNLELYNNSKLKYLDCSFNAGLKLNIWLPNCEKLYVTDCNLSHIDLELIPKIKILDCENNLLDKIVSANGFGSRLLELNVQNNKLNDLSIYPNLTMLNIDHNNLSVIVTYPDLKFLSAVSNKLIRIKSQPSLTELYVRHNGIKQIDIMPNLKKIDLAYNKLDNYQIPVNSEHVYIYFNPITNLSIEFSKLKELQIGFDTYKHICQTYHKEFEFMEIHCSMEELGRLLARMSNIFDSKTTAYIKKKISMVKFNERDVHLFKLTLILYWKYFHPDSIETMEELVKTKEFTRFLKVLKDLYYKTMVITSYFNGYRP